jgi:hypothetical protein
VTCHYCKRPGHIARCCPIKPRNKAERVAGLSNGGRCHHCGEPGHYARACPFKRKNQQPFPTEEEEEEDTKESARLTIAC